MKVEINHRGNGACPLCRNNESCRLKTALSASLASYPGSDMEIVVYQCPHFAERA